MVSDKEPVVCEMNDNKPTKNGNGTFDLRYLRLPIIAIVGLVSFFMWVTYVTLVRYQEIGNRMALIESHDEALEKRVDVIENSRWTKQDHVIWCYEAQQLNSSVNGKSWKCPPF